ncbi:hypothetical protein EV182_002118 [Spiromyces aspiralis]|uniref:Uncharacterized protein n=1 Tax=Spiromyces aspiralis TaxID=68401 RepID=A0ACC1HVQ7_9FUNG|nr:hypothetical protein EV182_002118 [Spiromyces aspiralis]
MDAAVTTIDAGVIDAAAIYTQPPVSLALLPLDIKFVQGFVIGSLALTSLFHALRIFQLVTTEKALAWVLTLTTSFVVAACSMPYLCVLARNRWDVRAVIRSDDLSNLATGFFASYLAWDLILGMIYYRARIQVLTGYIHHTAYLALVVRAAMLNYTAVFMMFCVMEVPTIILAFGHMQPQWRRDDLFSGVFFVTRIVLHLALMLGFYRMYPDRIIWKVVLAAFSLHVYWFYNILAQWRRLGCKQRGK